RKEMRREFTTASVLENSNRRCTGPTPATTTITRPSTDFNARHQNREIKLRCGAVGAEVADWRTPGVPKASSSSADWARASTPASRSGTGPRSTPKERSDAEGPGGECWDSISVSGAFFCSAAIQDPYLPRLQFCPRCG